MIIAFFKKRMKQLSITKYRLSKLTDISESNINRYFGSDMDMSLTNYLKICGALSLRPYLIPSEEDENEMNFIHFN